MSRKLVLHLSPDASDDDMDQDNRKRRDDRDYDQGTPPAKRVKLAAPPPSPSADMDARLDEEIVEAFEAQRDMIRGMTPDFPDHPRWIMDCCDWDTPRYDRAVEAWKKQVRNAEDSHVLM